MAFLNMLNSEQGLDNEGHSTYKVPNLMSNGSNRDVRPGKLSNNSAFDPSEKLLQQHQILVNTWMLSHLPNPPYILLLPK